MASLRAVIDLIFLGYTLLLVVRVLGGWFPRFSKTHIMRFVAHYTDPYLKIFRRFIPPIGGMLDLSPLFAFLTLRLMQWFITFLLR